MEVFLVSGIQLTSISMSVVTLMMYSSLYFILFYFFTSHKGQGIDCIFAFVSHICKPVSQPRNLCTCVMWAHIHVFQKPQDLIASLSSCRITQRARVESTTGSRAIMKVFCPVSAARWEESGMHFSINSIALIDQFHLFTRNQPLQVFYAQPAKMSNQLVMLTVGICLRENSGGAICCSSAKLSEHNSTAEDSPPRLCSSMSR